MSRPSSTDQSGLRTKLDASSRRVRFGDRLRAEALRWYESLHGPASHDTELHRLITDEGRDDETRIIDRARHLPVASQIDHAISRVGVVLLWMIIAGLAIGAGLGVATVRTSLDAADAGRVNFFWLLGSLLGVQTLALLVWAALLTISLIRGWRRGGESSEPLVAFSLGSAIIAAARWITMRLRHDPLTIAAMQALGEHSTRGAVGRWTLSAMSHAVWLAFNLGALVMVVLLLSARQYTFVWETTILSEREYVQLTHGLGRLPELCGFRVPDESQIIANQWTGADAAPPSSAAVRDAEAWSGLLLGSLVLYGFAPRIVLLGLSLSLRRMARRRVRLDLDLPYYAALRARLAPPIQQTAAMRSMANGRDLVHAAALSAAPPPPERPPGPPAIVGLEIPRPGSGWPPALHEVVWQDLGRIETRDDRERIVQHLRQDATQPKCLVLVVDLTTTPDRGLAALTSAVAAAVASPHVMLLTGGQRLRQRISDTEAVARRVADWRALAAQIGIDSARVVELDLDHLTDGGRQRLAGLLDSSDSAERGNDEPSRDRRIEPAFALIADAAADWFDADQSPSASQQAALHRRIAELYGGSAASFARRFGPGTFPGDVKAMKNVVTQSARDMLNLMPERLRRTSRWATAGALAGGIGCVAAAMTVSPIAIGSLPLWSTVGGILSGLVSEIRAQRASPRSETATSSDQDAFDLHDAVRGSALFALVLELQGYGEAAIARMLDATLPDPRDRAADADDEELTSPEDVRHWLDDLRHRLDLSLAREVHA